MNPQELDELFKRLEKESPLLLAQLKTGRIRVSYFENGDVAKYGLLSEEKNIKSEIIAVAKVWGKPAYYILKSFDEFELNRLFEYLEKYYSGVVRDLENGNTTDAVRRLGVQFNFLDFDRIHPKVLTFAKNWKKSN